MDDASEKLRDHEASTKTTSARRLFARWWYVRTPRCILTPEGLEVIGRGVVSLKASRLVSRDEVRCALAFAADQGMGAPVAVRVSVYRRAR